MVWWHPMTSLGCLSQDRGNSLLGGGWCKCCNQWFLMHFTHIDLPLRDMWNDLFGGSIQLTHPWITSIREITLNSKLIFFWLKDNILPTIWWQSHTGVLKDYKINIFQGGSLYVYLFLEILGWAMYTLVYLQWTNMHWFSKYPPRQTVKYRVLSNRSPGG